MPAIPSTESVTTGWKAVGGFFRVFDVAFFLPGAILTLGLVASWDPGLSRVSRVTNTVKGVPDWLSAVTLIVITIVLVFVAGLLCHAVARMVRFAMFRLGARFAKDTSESYFRHWNTVKAVFALGDDRIRVWGNRIYGPEVKKREPADPELLLYFWNMATLCWNVAAALGLLMMSLFFSPARAGWNLLLLLPALLLAMLGSEFRYFWEKDTRVGSQ